MTIIKRSEGKIDAVFVTKKDAKEFKKEEDKEVKPNKEKDSDAAQADNQVR